MFICKQSFGQPVRGFTLIELMVVVALIGIITTVAFPSFRSMVTKNRVTTAVASLHGALLLSRSEALKRGVPVTICRSENVHDASPSCAGSASVSLTNTGWADGWMVFSDNNSNGVYEPSANPAEVIVTVQNKLSRDVNDISIIPTSAIKHITFNPTGQVFGNFIQFDVKRPTADTVESHDRHICIATGGRAIVSEVDC